MGSVQVLFCTAPYGGIVFRLFKFDVMEIYGKENYLKCEASARFIRTHPTSFKDNSF